MRERDVTSVVKNLGGQIAILILTVVLGIPATAQESVTQQTNPPSVKWYRIQTANFNILYPQGFDTQAQRMANTLEQVHDPEAASLKVHPRKISVILQSRSAISNGFVTLAPRHSEFFAMPTQNYNLSGNLDWLTFLASHEYRHVAQFQRSQTGFTGLCSILFGQQAQAALAYVAAPQWFWEGDAVATETAFTHGGRGRIPNFDLIFRTNLMEGRVFNYNKQYLRSYKHNIPNHYLLGYNMVSYLRKKTNDPEVWEKIVRRSWNVPFIPFAFSNSIHHQTGEYVSGLYREMAAELTSEWKKNLDELTLTSFIPVNTRSDASYTDYLYPQVLSDGRVIAQKSGIGDIETLVILSANGEEKKFVQGPMNTTGMMSAGGDRVVWNEYRYDPRWLVRTYSVVKGYDVHDGSTQVLSPQSRYSGAAISPDGKLVATIETTTGYQTQLVVLDYNSRQEVKRFGNTSNEFISMPRWTTDGSAVVALTTHDGNKSISKFDLASGAISQVWQAGLENVGHPVPFGPFIFYNSPYSGIDNIYVLDTQSGNRYQVTCSKYGSYNPALSADGKTLYYNEQTRNGFDVVKIPLDRASWRPIEQIRKGEGFYQHLVAQEGRPQLLDSVGRTVFPTRRYHRASGMINPHSWGPYFTNNLTQAQVGIYSQDILSTTSINGGYQFDINERTGTWQAGVSYQGFYPIIDAQAYSGSRVQKTMIQDNLSKMTWDEAGASLGLRIPLLLTHSKYDVSFEIGNSVSLANIYNFKNVVTQGDSVIHTRYDRFVPVTINVNNKPTDAVYLLADKPANGNLLSNFFHATYFRSLKLSRRDFNPRWGQYLNFESYSTPFGGDFYGWQWTVNGVLYFPGLVKHHSLYFRGGYQSSADIYEEDRYTFRNQLVKPRGYSYPNDHTFYTLQSNYQFPVWYPDAAIGPVLNIQRIKANLFYDYGHGETSFYYYDLPNGNGAYLQLQSLYQSAGAEITFDVNIMRFLPQVEVGIRVTHRNANAFNTAGTIYEFLIGNIPF